jgi:hypothetical protein
MNRRRFVLGAAAAAAMPAIAYAQTTTTTPTGCAIGFVNGLLTMSPECPLLTPPGLNMAVAPPSHLTMEAEAEANAADAGAAAQAAADEEALRLQERRDRKHDKKNRRRENRRGKRSRGTDRKQRKRENRRDRREPSFAESVTCDDFATKAELDAWWVEYSEVSTQLDPNGNGKPCEDVIWPEPTPSEP